MSSRLTEIIKDVYDRTALVKHINALTGGTNAIAAAVVTAGGTGYSDSFAVTFTGGGGSGAAGTATAVDGVITSIAITAAGTGYTSAPTPVLTAGGGSGGTAVAVLGAETLDAVLTANVPVGTLQLSVVVSGALYHYDLVSGTDAESSPAIIRPDDYATTTNEKVWKRISPYQVYATATNDKDTTASVEYLTGIRSNDASNPLQLRLGIKTHDTDASRALYIDAEDAGTGRALVLNPSGGNVGVGSDFTPTDRFHIRTSDLGFDSTFLDQGVGITYPLIVEAGDAVMALVSSDEGDHGSAFQLAEVDGGVLGHSWTFLVKASGATTNGSAFEFLAGTDKNYTNNPCRLFCTFDGKRSAIGGVSKADESYADSYWNFACVGDDTRIRSVSSDGGNWGGAFCIDQFDFSNGSGSMFENTWALVRQTDGDGTGDGRLSLTYGTNTDPALNQDIARFMPSTRRMSIGGLAPLGQLHVSQYSTTGAVPVLYLNQADVSEQIFTITSTAGVGNAVESVGVKTLTTTAFIKITLNGNTRYIPVGTIA